jgi:hypothetical protein
MTQIERRIDNRRESDRICEDCLLFRDQIKRAEKLGEENNARISAGLAVAHRRIDNLVPIWIFSIVTVIYLSLAGYQTVKMVEMSNQLAVLQTKVASVEDVMKGRRQVP